MVLWFCNGIKVFIRYSSVSKCLLSKEAFAPLFAIGIIERILSAKCEAKNSMIRRKNDTIKRNSCIITCHLRLLLRLLSDD
eukprot:08132.XXX_476779_477021_1 [CDS] Oithona nana genome sequencing.